MGATFAFTETAVANHRQTNDAWNGAAGACSAGFLAGLRCAHLVLILLNVSDLFIKLVHYLWRWAVV